MVRGCILSAADFVCHFLTSFHRKSLQMFTLSSCYDVMSVVEAQSSFCSIYFETGSDFCHV